MINITEIKATLGEYLKDHSTDAQSLKPLETNLQDGSNLTSRSHMPIHVTTSGVVIRNNKVLYIKHLALNKWLLPGGGHCELEDDSLVDASLREIEEETGISARNLVLLSSTPVDIDLHIIPANQKKEEPEHWHADFRYVFQLNDAEIVLQEEEVTDYEWISIDEIPMDRLAERLHTIV